MKYKFPSFFVFNLKKTYKKEIEIKEIILRTTSKEKDSSDNLENLPYLILDLNLNNNLGSNNFLKSASLVLSNYETKGDYRYFKVDSKIILEKEISNLEIKIRKPNGDMYNFGSINNEYINTVCFFYLQVF